jgi:hypothetical protein
MHKVSTPKLGGKKAAHPKPSKRERQAYRKAIELHGKPNRYKLPPAWHELLGRLERLRDAFGQRANQDEGAPFAAVETVLVALAAYARRMGTWEDAGFGVMFSWTPPRVRV